ncbi:hypothetical protein MTP10_08575 [Nonomuraea sp. 3-1Str]|uniref:hypothetical protein n=1 Tax=Nonomuraea sp. 3-1Str TaxID=2929801 RepID=UPI00285940D0|nr:hypothetical protein [Nonomuraea sp. 3-1Str]MDR8408792.1 hypothetical protein [Nonomuraea sp. 3-1Str]
MQKLIAAATLAGSLATGLALAAPAAQAATTTATAGAARSAPVHKWGTFYSKSHRAHSYGYTWKSGGRVYTKWYGKESTPKSGWIWFRYEVKGGGGGKFVRQWDGSRSETWSKKGLARVYTYTCWGGKFNDCGKVYRIY